MMYKQVKRRKIYEEIADQLLDKIKSGNLSPGDKLDSVQSLAEGFNVGRSAVREALSALRAMGLVEMRQGEGTFVKHYDRSTLIQSISTGILMNREEIIELLEVRKILETGCAASAAEKRTEKELFEISKALSDMQKAVSHQQLGEQADLQFHMAITAASHNRLLGDLMNQVSQLMVDSIRETRKLSLYSDAAILEKLYTEHNEIFLAIKHKDSVKAQQAMLHHLNEVEIFLLKHM
ncbi:FadR/GntR family transcriptional regulator [Pseudalkalibacillus hwajinpoensis]|uniref:FadR family transcriptional regulator n=1 Tax=Guptibacillus hwajinpoensis TaxID=208199 RepID=A0A4U1ML55_9BACL|nr:FadR/GntR family transcriptional regulator [Pseudalkalibacillus hwajinpoensis]TKD71356.1 FadR family transcriptional regulator [Pseudalkalibacillus hwajinpoensis]